MYVFISVLTASNVQYGSDRKPFDHQMGGVPCIN